MTHPGKNDSNIPFETRLALMERDIEVLKLRDQDVRSWQEGINKIAYKTEALERALDSTREKIDELSSLFRDASKSSKETNVIITTEFEKLNKKIGTKEDSGNNSSLVKTIVNTIFLILFVAATILGIKIPGGFGG